MYINRINQLGESNPQLLITNIYIRHMCDLFGGQILKK
uniref:Uncharacterized protein n=1 Tax=Kuetzingia canaliculata TaxID=228262 RepID=A0A1Z1MQ50_KUECA|nr:hypothetical protein [Kuetzingia canaliculata]ARW67891.1 hypothetical protein [Kuetzingia canaliculata]